MPAPKKKIKDLQELKSSKKSSSKKSPSKSNVSSNLTTGFQLSSKQSFNKKELDVENSEFDSTDLDDVNLLEQNTIEKLILQSLTRYKKEVLADDKQQKLVELNHLGSIIEEYLSCFTVIGYSMQGEKVCLFNAPTSKDEAALVDLLRATFLEIVNNRP